MPATLRWHTQAGTLTEDNRDTCAHIELPDAGLYLIADGSSAHPGSGELAAALLTALVEGFSHLPATDLSPQQLAEALRQLIGNSQQALRHTHPQAACSYLALCLHGDAAFSLHEGDCCLGLIEADSTISWLSSVHCRANWQGNLAHSQLAQMPLRHSLTRCFTPRRESDPEIQHWRPGAKRHWLLATDGFWAGLNELQQQGFLRDGSLPAAPTDDDISCLCITPPLI